MIEGENILNKKGKTVVFMIIATLLNLVLLAVFFLLLFAFLFGLLPTLVPAVMEIPAMSFVLPLLWFGGAIFLSFLVYSRLIRWATVKFDLENKLDPIFTPKKNRRERGE